jgi:tetratricopeptide (TPR) repeat protein
MSTLRGVPISEAVDRLGNLIDGAFDRRSIDDLEHAVSLANDLNAHPIDVASNPEFNYYLANAWADLRTLRRHGKPETWEWKQPEFERELYYLRLAAHSEGFATLLPIRRAQILTNTGNLLNTIGRSFEAIELYDQAMASVPKFGMAMANQGLALMAIARAHHDLGQAHHIMRAAWQGLTKAPRSHLEPAAAEFFDTIAKQIEGWLPRKFLRSRKVIPAFSLGKTKRERLYRQWCLDQRLFLNPLLAIGPFSIAARDTLNLPGIVVPIGEGPGLLGMYNQIKQEFVSARYLLWEAMTSNRGHFSDHDTHIVDTLDYPSYGIGLERARLAFRMAYSILDKCAFLLNKYLALGISDRAVNLNRVWFKGGEPKKGLNPTLLDSANWPLRGLYWLARDLYDEGPFVDAVEPQARELKSIRDHLEHKYLKIHEFGPPTGVGASFLHDQYAHSIGKADFDAKTFKIVKLARSAIIYLSWGVHANERELAQGRPSTTIVPPMPLPNVIDKWKT